jgi:hypothetical protein
MPRRSRPAAASRSKFPTRVAILDACVLIRLHKCDALDLIAKTIELIISEHAYGEFAAGGPAAKAALTKLDVVKRSIIVGSPEWTHLALLRAEFSTVDLGEDQSIAIALAEADRNNFMPIVTYDHGAEQKARNHDVATVSFLETLAWLVTCGRLSVEAAEEIEDRAKSRDGWKRRSTQVGSFADQIKPLCDALTVAIESKKPPKRKGRR